MGKHITVQAAKKPKASNTRPSSRPGNKVMMWFQVCIIPTLCTVHQCKAGKASMGPAHGADRYCCLLLPQNKQNLGWYVLTTGSMLYVCQTIATLYNIASKEVTAPATCLTAVSNYYPLCRS